ncbi:MAG: Rubrerythrin [Syntrophorhabdus sp. PtaB.Bin047]|jgi:rubrerythrin|nr:MAG: Rubrerythrin [Syntrophorhabdus sp. PtaB.Bin047]
MGTKDLSAIIDLAISKEEEAYDFYMELATMVDDRSAKDALQIVAGEEKKHKEFLVNYRDKGYGNSGLKMTSVVDYKIAEHLEAPEPKTGMESKDVFLIAAHRERSAHEFYIGLASIHPAGPTKDMLLAMAQEELKHKEKMEYYYANAAFPQTSGG